MKHVKTTLLAALFVGTSISISHAGTIPYPSAGTYNNTSYTFTAQSNGDVIGYFDGSGAAYTNLAGLLVNGTLTPAGFGLNNKTSAVGESFDFGTVHVGDVLTFVLQDQTLNSTAYSNPSLNVAYDNATDTIGHNHIYSTSFTASGAIPSGTYVGFEDLPFPDSDFNYVDEQFVFTNVSASVGPVSASPVSAAPEPGTWALILGGVGVIGAALRLAVARRRENDAWNAAA